MEKYIGKKSDGIANCPFCRGVLLRDFKIDKASGATTFITRCPHCKKNVSVLIDKNGIVIKPQGNEPKH